MRAGRRTVKMALRVALRIQEFAMGLNLSTPRMYCGAQCKSPVVRQNVYCFRPGRCCGQVCPAAFLSGYGRNVLPGFFYSQSHNGPSCNRVKVYGHIDCFIIRRDGAAAIAYLSLLRSFSGKVLRTPHSRSGLYPSGIRRRKGRPG